MDGCTDGMYEGIQYFESQPGKGKFVKVLELQPDKQYSSGTTGVIPMPSFEVGSMVQFGDPAEYGKVTWIGCPFEDGEGEKCARVLAVRCRCTHTHTHTHAHTHIYTHTHTHTCMHARTQNTHCIA